VLESNISITGYSFTSGVQVVEQIWVTIAEAAEITGYSISYMRRMTSRLWNSAENERTLKLRKRSGRLELWLPDLMAYAETRGPYKKTELTA